MCVNKSVALRIASIHFKYGQMNVLYYIIILHNVIELWDNPTSTELTSNYVLGMQYLLIQASCVS